MGDSRRYVLPDSDIIAFLEPSCNFTITSQMIKNPSVGFVHTVFKCFLRDLQVNVDTMDSMPWNEEHDVEFKELYQDVSLPIFFTIMKKFMISAGIVDFSIKDLLEPKPNRTKKIFTHLITFWKHSLTMMKKFEDIEIDLQTEIDEEKKLLDINDQLSVKFQDLQKDKVDPEKRQHLLNVRESKNFEGIRQKKDAIYNQYQVLKTDIANEEQKASELDVNIISEKEKIEDLNNRILKSPDRLTSDIDDIKQKIKDEDDKLLELTKKKEEKKQDIQAFTTCMENFTKSSEGIGEVMESVDLLKKEALVIDEKQKILDEKTQELKAVEAQWEELQQNISSSEQKRAQADLQIKMQIEGQKKILEVNQWGLEKESAVARKLQDDATAANQDLLNAQEKYDKVCNEIKIQENKLKEQLLEKKKEYDDYVQSFIYDVNLAKEIIKEADFEH